MVRSVVKVPAAAIGVVRLVVTLRAVLTSAATVSLWTPTSEQAVYPFVVLRINEIKIQPMKKLISTLILAIVLFSCSSDSDEQTISTPTLTTSVATSISQTGAISGGNIISDGGGAISSIGVVWSTTQNPTVALSTKTTDGSGIGDFTSSISGLSPNTQYYVIAYATNSAGTAYGNELVFSTLNPNYATYLSNRNGIL